MIRVFCSKGQVDIEVNSASVDTENNLVLTADEKTVSVFHRDCWDYYQVVEAE